MACKRSPVRARRSEVRLQDAGCDELSTSERSIRRSGETGGATLRRKNGEEERGMAGQMVRITRSRPVDTGKCRRSSGRAVRLAVRGVPRPDRVPHDAVRREDREARSTEDTSRGSGARTTSTLTTSTPAPRGSRSSAARPDEPSPFPAWAGSSTATTTEGNEFGLWQIDARRPPGA